MQDFSNLTFNQDHGRSMRRQALDHDVATGQKMIIYAVLINLLVLGMTVALPSANLMPDIGGLLLLGGWVLSFAAGVVALLGLMRIGKGFEWPVIGRLALAVLAFLPCISLLMLLSINARATAHLKAAGYQVGLMGARPKH